MGQAKRKIAERQAIEEQLKDFDVPRLATAIRKLITSASLPFGADCYTHAILGQAVLASHGIAAKLCVGFAAWRVGEGDSDVIQHAPVANMPVQPGGVAYHVWLEIGSKLLDLTTYQLRHKARNLDLLDGGHTNVEWCPDYLFVEKGSCKTPQEVRQLNAGLYCYMHNKDVETLILSTAPETDSGDVNAALMLYANPDLVVIGPNDEVHLTSTP